MIFPNVSIPQCCPATSPQFSVLKSLFKSLSGLLIQLGLRKSLDFSQTLEKQKPQTNPTGNVLEFSDSSEGM